MSFTCAVRSLLLSREKEGGTRAKKRAGTIGRNGGSNAVDGGPVWALRRARERGREGRWTNAIEIFSRSLGRGSWPRRVWLAPSVGPRRPGKSPLGPSHPCGRTREHDGKKNKRKNKKGLGGKKKVRSEPDEDQLTRVVGTFPLRSVHS